MKPIRKLGTEYSFSKTTLVSRREILTDSSSLVPYRIYTFTPKNMMCGLWMVSDFAEQLYELIQCGREVAGKKYRWNSSGHWKYKVAICRGYVKIVNCHIRDIILFLYLLVSVMNLSMRRDICITALCVCAVWEGFIYSFFFINIRRNIWTVVQSHVEWWAA